MKRDRVPREALAQAIDYAADIATWSLDKLGELCATYSGQSLEDALVEAFPDIDAVLVSDDEHLLKLADRIPVLTAPTFLARFVTP